MTLLHLKTEEAMTSRADSVASGTCNPSLVKTRFENKKGFLQVRAHYLTKTSNDFAIRRLLGTLEEKSSTLLRHLAQCGGCGQQIVDAVIVHFIHADNDGIFGSVIDVDVNVVDSGRLWQG